MVAKEWASVNMGDNPLEIWQNKIWHIRQYLRGWATNLSGSYKLKGTFAYYYRYSGT
jgi:hypothetical protein